MYRVREEVTRISDEDDEARLNLRLPSHMRHLKHQTCRQPDHQPNHQTPKEHQQKHPNTLHQRKRSQLPRLRALAILLRRLKKHNRNRVIQDTLPEYNGIEFGIDFVSVEDCEDGYGVRGAEVDGGDERAGCC